MNEEPGQHYQDKYHTRNPLARYLVDNFFSTFKGMALRSPVRTALEVGCGEGELTRCLVQSGFAMQGFDISAVAISEAHRLSAAAGMSIRFEQAALADVAARQQAPLVVCCEVLEHIPDPQAALAQLAAMADPWLLVSVPREPIWRALNMCRGKYWRDFGNTPGHLNHWSSAAFQRFLAKHFEIVELRQPLPWTMALCRRI